MPRRDINNSIQTWKSLARPNYPLMYINRWIPFNAWYYSVTDQQNDRDCFQFFKDHPGNVLYNRIKQLLAKSSSNFDCLFFQNQFNLLETALKHKDVPDPATPEPIYFGLIEMRPNTVDYDKMKKLAGIQYKAVRYQNGNAQGKPAKSVEVIVEDLRTHTVNVVYSHNDWDLADFTLRLSRMRTINASQKKVVKELFTAINPIVTVDIKNMKSGKIKIGTSHFCNDKDAICASIMSVLYALRCKAVHAEVDITPKVEQIYEYAYQMLTLITKELY